MANEVKFAKASCIFDICKPAVYKRRFTASDFAFEARKMQEGSSEPVNFYFTDMFSSLEDMSAVEMTVTFNENYSLTFETWLRIVRKVTKNLIYNYDIRETILFVNGVPELVEQD